MAIIMVFIASLLIYFYIQRRKRLALNPREGYEFEMLNEEDEQESGLLGGGRKKGGRGGNRRAGELYDAFAGESDEDSLFDEEDEREGRRSVDSEEDEDERLREK